MTKKQKKNYY